MSMIHCHLISGIMFGIEFPPCEEPDEQFVITIDIFFIRIHYVKFK